MTLSTRPRFSRRLKLLQKLITEKKTITEYYLLTKTKYSEDPRADDDRSSDPYHVSMEPGAAAKGAEDGDALGHKSSENEGGEVHRLREENDLASAEEYDPESNTVFDDSLEEGEGAETKAEDQQIHDNNNGIGNGPDPRESSDVAQPITNTREYHPHPNTDAKPDSASYDDIVEEAEHNTDADREPDGQRVAHESEKQTASGHHSASSDRGTGQVTDGTKDGNGQNTRHGKGSETKNLTMADRRQNLSLGKEASIMPYAIRPGGPPGNFNTVDGDLRHDAIEHDMSGLADGNTESEVQISSRPVDEANKAYTLTSEAPEADVSQRSSVTATGHESSPTQLEEQLNTDEAEAGGNFTAAFDLDDTLYEPDLATDNESEIAFPYEEVDELGVDEQPEDEVAQHSHTTKDNPDSLSLLPGRRSPSTSSKRSRDDTELQSETVEDASNGTKRVRSQR